jgi:ferredoxin
MRVWIDQDCCTGAGLCVDHCPELFIVLEDGIGYVHDGGLVLEDAASPSLPVPRRYERAAVDAAERCPGECIYLEADRPPPSPSDDDESGIADAGIVDAEVVVDGGDD